MAQIYLWICLRCLVLRLLSSLSVQRTTNLIILSQSKVSCRVPFWDPFHFQFLYVHLKYVYPLVCFVAPKSVYSQGVTSYTQSQQTRQVTVIKPAAPSPASSTFSIYPVTSTVQPVAAAASVVPSYSQSPTYSTNAVTYSGKLHHLIYYKNAFPGLETLFH